MIELKYSCILCGLHRVTCSVEARKPGQATGEWIDSAGRALWADHDRRSKSCHPQHLSEVMIPILENQSLGSSAS